jgi:hypothetical protein
MGSACMGCQGLKEVRGEEFTLKSRASPLLLHQWRVGGVVCHVPEKSMQHTASQVNDQLGLLFESFDCPWKIFRVNAGRVEISTTYVTA